MRTYLTAEPRPFVVWFGLLLISMASACSPDPTTAENVSEEFASTNPAASLAATHFSPEVMEALITIKTRFEQGLRVGKEKRSVGYAYEQHAIRMRLDFFDEVQITNNYPFNGKFSLTEVADAVEQLPFITDKCGFAVGEDQVVNYYCPAINENYFAYLGKLSDPEGIIASFVSTYKAAKTITPSIRQQMVLSAQESLDFDNWDHQLFYCLVQCWTNAEVQAYVKVNLLQVTAAQRAG